MDKQKGNGKSIRIPSECLLCMGRNLTLKFPEDAPEEQRIRFIQEVYTLLGSMSLTDTAPKATRDIMHLREEMFGPEKDYASLKSRYNAKVMKYEDRIRAEIQTAPDPLKRAIQYSIYGNYIDLQTKSSALRTFQEIAETLFYDCNDYGRPNFYNGKPTNPNITTISKKEIEEFEKEAKDYLSRVESQARVVNKKALMLQRKLKSKRLKGQERSAVEQEHAVEILQLRNLNVIYNIATELVDFANQFKLRLEAANQDLNPTWLGNFCENLVDFLTGAASVEKPVLDSVYAHKSEFNYIKYLKMLLKDFSSPESVKAAYSKPIEVQKVQ